MEFIPFIGAMTLAIPVESNGGASPFQPLMESSETSFDVPSLKMEDLMSEELRDIDSPFVRSAKYNNKASNSSGNLIYFLMCQIIIFKLIKLLVLPQES